MIKLAAKYFYKGANVKNYPVTLGQDKETELYRQLLKQTCADSKKKLNILEVGCGTGLYFSCLSNISKLVGLDVSEEMIKRAKANVSDNFDHLKDVTTLINTGIEDFQTNDKFDFIYSIGTLGEYCSFNDYLFNKLLGFLSPGGFLFFTIVDSASYKKVRVTNKKTILGRYALRIMPDFIKRKIGYKFVITDDYSFQFMSKQQILDILERYRDIIKWDLTLAKDKKHIHHICKISVLCPTKNDLNGG